MTSLLEIWVIVAFLGFTLAAPLGPINAEMIKQVLNKSIPNNVAWLAAVLTGIGALTGDFIVAFSFLTIGGELLITIFTNPLIRLLLFSVNILILGYLGLTALFSKEENIEKEIVGKVQNNPRKENNYIKRFVRQYLTGFSIVITSPWSYLWWVSFGTLILFSDFNVPDLLSKLIIVSMFLSGIITLILLFTTSLSIVGRIPNPKIFYWITKLTAILLLLLTVPMFIEALKALEEIILQ